MVLECCKDCGQNLREAMLHDEVSCFRGCADWLKANKLRTVLTVVCMDCSCLMGERDGQGVSGVSHGLCPDCLARRRVEAKQSRNDYWSNNDNGYEVAGQLNED